MKTISFQNQPWEKIKKVYAYLIERYRIVRLHFKRNGLLFNGKIEIR